MEEQKQIEYYTRDYENINDVDGIKKRIAYLEKLKGELIAYRGSGLSDDANQKINDMLEVLDRDLEFQNDELNRFLPEGVYSLYTDCAWFKKGTLIKREVDPNEPVDEYDHSVCEKCIFGKIPCLSINSYYGCHRRKFSRGNERQGINLVREGYFVLYEGDKNEN